MLSGEIHAHNTFDQPAALVPQLCDVSASGATIKISLPPASVLAAEIQLA